MDFLGQSLEVTSAKELIMFVSDPKHRVTLAELSISLDGVTFIGSGTTKRMTGDPDTAEYGRLVALERALKELHAVVAAEVQKQA